MIYIVAILFFASVVALPKFLIFGAPILLSDLILLIGSIYFLFFKKRILKVLSFVLLWISFFFILNIVFNFIFKTVLIVDILLFIKRFIYIFSGFLISGYFKKYYVDIDFIRILSAFLLIGIVPLCFSFFEILSFLVYGFKFDQINLVNYDLNSYNTSMVPVGFTGRAVDVNNLYLIGSSSINYGILNSVLASLSFMFYAHQKRFFYLLLFLMYLFGAVLSRSSSVFVVLFFSLVYFFFNYLKFRIYSVFILPIFFVGLGISNLDIVLDAIQTLNSILGNSNGDFDSWELRLITFKMTFAAFISEPILLIFGSGYGMSMARALSKDDSLIESFFFETMLGMGLIPSFALFSLIICAQMNLKQYRFGILRSLKNYMLFLLPIFIILNLISGNIYGNEYLGFLLFFLIGYMTKLT